MRNYLDTVCLLSTDEFGEKGPSTPFVTVLLGSEGERRKETETPWPHHQGLTIPTFFVVSNRTIGGKAES